MDILPGSVGLGLPGHRAGGGRGPLRAPVSLSVEGGVAAPSLPRGCPAAPARADPAFPPQLSSPMNPVSSSEDIKPPLGLNGVLKVPAHPSGNMASFTKHICAICGDRSSGGPPRAGRSGAAGPPGGAGRGGAGLQDPCWCWGGGWQEPGLASEGPPELPAAHPGHLSSSKSRRWWPGSGAGGSSGDAGQGAAVLCPGPRAPRTPPPRTQQPRWQAG